jgi:hypothetical protein
MYTSAKSSSRSAKSSSKSSINSDNLFFVFVVGLGADLEDIRCSWEGTLVGGLGAGLGDLGEEEEVRELSRTGPFGLLVVSSTIRNMSSSAKARYCSGEGGRV